MNRKICYKKLDEDDILEILIEHFQNGELSDFISARGCILGKPGDDLRFVGVFSKSDKQVLNQDLEEIDKGINYNGDHSFLKTHTEYNLDPEFQKNRNKE